LGVRRPLSAEVKDLNLNNDNLKFCISILRNKFKFVLMSEKELKEFQKVLEKQRTEVSTSKEAAKKLLLELGLITNSGNLSKSFKPVKASK